MSPNPSTPTPDPPAGTEQLAPPAPGSWRRYSPHHEFPLSGVSSIALHGLLAAGLVWLGLHLADGGRSDPIKMDVIQISPGTGQGGPDGQADPPQAHAVPRPEAAALSKASPESPSLPPVGPVPLRAPTPDASAALPKLDRTLPFGAPDPGFRDVDRMRRDLEQRMAQARGSEHGGKHSPGPGNSAGSGLGGWGGPGPTTATIEHKRRVKRSQRWVMLFNTLTGEDYLSQLAGLGAILAVPESGGGYRVFRDLQHRPPVGRVEDVARIDRIFWIDDTPPSVASLAQALALDPLPRAVAAFFPVELEKELARLEHAYAGRGEEEIHETRFQIVHSGGRYVPVVVSQR